MHTGDPKAPISLKVPFQHEWQFFYSYKAGDSFRRPFHGLYTLAPPETMMKHAVRTESYIGHWEVREREDVILGMSSVMFPTLSINNQQFHGQEWHTGSYIYSDEMMSV